MFGNIRMNTWFTWYAPNHLIGCVRFFVYCKGKQFNGDLYHGELADEDVDPSLIQFYRGISFKSDSLIRRSR